MALANGPPPPTPRRRKRKKREFTKRPGALCRKKHSSSVFSILLNLGRTSTVKLFFASAAILRNARKILSAALKERSRFHSAIPTKGRGHSEELRRTMTAISESVPENALSVFR